MTAASGEDIERLLDEDCAICGHPFNPHVLVATLHDPQFGGLVFCQETGCRCQSTWSVEGAEEPYYPDDETVEELRELAQSEPDD